jgi:hypothetical protein
MSLGESLRKLTAANEQLAHLDDQLAAMIVAIEEALRRCTSVRISIEIGDGEVLSFAKFSSTWRLMIEHEVKGHAPNRTPLAQCPRGTRARMFKDKLVARLIENADADVIDQIADREVALAEATALRDQLLGAREENPEGLAMSNPLGLKPQPTKRENT